jgi:hypothetical protein
MHFLARNRRSSNMALLHHGCYSALSGLMRIYFYFNSQDSRPVLVYNALSGLLSKNNASIHFPDSNSPQPVCRQGRLEAKKAHLSATCVAERMGFRGIERVSSSFAVNELRDLIF